MNSTLRWLHHNSLILVCGFLISFIPLYPKVPLFDALPGYIVRVRLEDFLILGATLLWAYNVWKRRILLDNRMAKIVGVYILAGALSIVSGILITKTIPADGFVHIFKSLLHLFRYIEYFTLFFITFSAVRSRDDARLLLSILVATTALVTLYAIGQKYLYWPVYSTMNREFSKGVRLYLTEHARVQSTFGGHYDFAGYLVLLMPFILSIIYSVKHRLKKYALWMLFLLCLWSLTVSASRISYVSYVIGISATVVLMSLKEATLQKKVITSFKRLAVVGILTFIVFEQFGTDIRDRMLHFLEAFPKIHSAYHESNKVRKEFIENSMLRFGLVQQKPDNGISTDQARQVITKTDQRPVPADVYNSVPDQVPVTVTDDDGNTETFVVEKERIFSDNAMKYGLSMAIRLDSLWPQALAGFQKNPLVGSGYATLTKARNDVFTEADSTDNNFLRTLGETGALGFISFYGAIAIVAASAIRLLKQSDPIGIVLGVGFLGATIGLLFNALLIDVFAASKIAFTFWSIAGLTYAYSYHLSQSTFVNNSIPQDRRANAGSKK